MTTPLPLPLPSRSRVRKRAPLPLLILCVCVASRFAKGELSVRRLALPLSLSGGAGYSSSSPVEVNPHYTGQVQTLGDLEQRQSYPAAPPSSTSTFTSYNRRRAVKPLPVAIKEYLQALKQTSPTLLYTLYSILSVFLLWRVPLYQLQRFLQNNFVCSGFNVLDKKRYHTLLTSTLSHVSFMHVLINTMVFLNFGPTVAAHIRSAAARRRFMKRRQSNQFLAKLGGEVWPFAVGSALAGSAVYLLLESSGRGVMGLSGVTVALLTAYGRLYPTRQLGVYLFGILPVFMPAEYAIYGTGCISLFGALASRSGMIRDGVAHAAHLGGFLFGLLYYELLMK